MKFKKVSQDVFIGKPDDPNKKKVAEVVVYYQSLMIPEKNATYAMEVSASYLAEKLAEDLNNESTKSEN